MKNFTYCYVIVGAFILSGYLCATATGVLDCDSSYPAAAVTCGSYSLCPNNSIWSTTYPTCSGAQINTTEAQYKCWVYNPPRPGSTRCGTTNDFVTCTTRQDCQRESQHLEGITYYRCHGQGTAVQNSVEEKTDYVTCNDTTES